MIIIILIIYDQPYYVQKRGELLKGKIRLQLEILTLPALRKVFGLLLFILPLLDSFYFPLVRFAKF